MEKTINFQDFMAKKHHFEGLTEQELASYETFKNMLVYGTLTLVAFKLASPLLAVGLGVKTAFLLK